MRNSYKIKISLVMVLLVIMLVGCKDNLAENTVYHTVSFDTQDGTPIEQQSILENNKVSRPETIPQREGYIFMDWYMDIEGITRFDFETPIGDDITIFAKWRLPIGSNRSFKYSLNSSFDLILFDLDHDSRLTSDVELTTLNGQVIIENEVIKTFNVGVNTFEIQVDSEVVLIKLEITEVTKPYVINVHSLTFKEGIDVTLQLELFDQIFISLSHNEMTTDDYTWDNGTLTITATYLETVLTDENNVVMILQYMLDSNYSSIFVTIKK